VQNNRILIADDEPDFTEIIGAVAEGIGFEITVVHEGSEVVGRVSGIDPGVIILDLRMPGADGVEVLKQLAEIGCSAPIILISGLGQGTLNSVEMVGKDKKLNVVGSLSKPMTPDDIEAALKPYTASAMPAEVDPVVHAEKPDFQFGLQTHFLPHKNLADESCVMQRASLEGSWVLDNKDVLAGTKLLNWAYESGTSIGFIDLILRNAQQHFTALGDGLQRLEIAMHLTPELLQDEGVADHVAAVVAANDFPLDRFVLEVDEKGTNLHQATAGEVLSRFRIKGFKIAIVTESNGDELLTMIDKLPMDELVVDLNQLNNSDQLEGNMELEFGYSSLISVAKKKGIRACAHNVHSYGLLQFAKRCKFEFARGSAISPTVPTAELASYLT